ncbi:MAG: hypothetical protein IKV57_03980 [Clostridia bacterium]|nr:hypothetical protein [Clostridia bacterium]
MMDKFPIGFWNYTVAGQQTAKDVEDWADLGMTMANSPEYWEGCDKQAMLDILDACEEKGIKVILCDHRARWWGISEDPEGAKAMFARALDDFGSHPAVLGFHVGDEPHTDVMFAESIMSHKMQLEMAPHLVPHLNFLPYWDGQEESLLKFPTFTEWAQSMADRAGLKILCYDCYTQMNPEEAGVHQYFKNLYKFMEAADATGITPWTTLLSVGHFRYRCPSEDDLRWQLNTAVASGMKGILWFFVYERIPTSNYRLPPIDEFGERTPTFHAMSRVNRHFLHQFGDFFLHAKHISTYHTGKAYGGYPMFVPGETSDVIQDVFCDQGLPAVVSFFEKDGGKYVAVVNNSTTESGLFKILVPKGTPVFQRFDWNHRCVDMKTNAWDAHYAETDTVCIGGDWLAPGQMKLYRYAQE